MVKSQYLTNIRCCKKSSVRKRTRTADRLHARQYANHYTKEPSIVSIGICLYCCIFNFFQFCEIHDKEMTEFEIFGKKLRLKFLNFTFKIFLTNKMLKKNLDIHQTPQSELSSSSWPITSSELKSRRYMQGQLVTSQCHAKQG